MKYLTGFYRQAIGLTAAFLATTTLLSAPAFENTLEKTFQAAPGGKLVVQVDQGSCTVSPAQIATVVVRVVRQVRGGDKTEAAELFANHQVNFAQAGNTVSVLSNRKKLPAWSSKPKGAYLEVRYEISIPKRFDVDLKLSGGDLKLGDLDGKARVRNASGGIYFQGVTGDVAATNAGGDITIFEAGGDIALQTSSGVITARKAKGKVEVSNSGGNIRIDDAE